MFYRETRVWRGSRRFGLGLLALAAMAAAPGAWAAQFSSLYSFRNNGDGATPYAAPVVDADGKLYGTTAGDSSAPSANAGTVYRFDPATGLLSTLKTFSISAYSSGATPMAGLLSSGGTFYGTTIAGGTFVPGRTGQQGTVFSISTSGSFSILHTLSDDDGGTPRGELVVGGDGRLYGTTSLGARRVEGVSGPLAQFSGSVFAITTDGKLTVLHRFENADGTADGQFPLAGLTVGPDQALYGTTSQGGAKGAGTVFRITNDGSFSTLHSFDTVNGANPASALARGSDGKLYGTTPLGGSDGGGVVFSITPQGNFSVIYRFKGGADGGAPNDVIFGGDGKLYGTTQGGGSSGGTFGGNGTVFQLTTAGALSTLHTFSGDDGRYPVSGLVAASNGVFYGTTGGGGSGGVGTIYKIVVDGAGGSGGGGSSGGGSGGGGSSGDGDPADEDDGSGGGSFGSFGVGLLALAALRRLRRAAPLGVVTAALVAPAAQAEPLVYITPTLYGEVQSSAPAVDTTPDGAVRYQLPGGYTAIGIDVAIKPNLLFAIGRNSQSGQCQLFQVDPSSDGDSFQARDGAYACSAKAGDFDVLTQDYALYEYLLVDGLSAIDVIHDNGSGSLVSVSRLMLTGTLTRDLAAIAEAPGGTLYAVTREMPHLLALVPELDGGGNPLGLRVTGSVALPSVIRMDGPISLDVSASSGAVYLMSNGQLYALTRIVPASDGGSGSLDLTALGAVPAGSIAVVAAQGLTTDNSQTLNTPAGAVTLRASAGSVWAEAIATPTGAPSGYEYRLGFFSYEIRDLTPGQSIDITFTVPDGVRANNVVKCFRQGSCRPYETRINGRELTITLTDGGEGDDDGIANGVIVDPAAPAYKLSSSGGSGADSGSGTVTWPDKNGGAFGAGSLFGMGALALLANAVRRRRAPSGSGAANRGDTQHKGAAA